MSDSNYYLIIIAIVVVIGISIIGPKNIIFEITGSEYMTRDVEDTVYLDSVDDSFTVEYEAHNTEGKWGVSVVDELSGDCSYIGALEPLEFVLTNENIEGSSYEFQVAPNSKSADMSCSFSGDYKFGEFDKESFDDKTVNIKFRTCIDSTPSAELYRNGNIVASTGYCSYTFNPGDKIELKKEGYETITHTLTTSEYGTSLSYNLQETQECDSEADTNEDGEITSLELADYSQKWLNDQVSRTKLGVAIQEWANGC